MEAVVTVRIAATPRLLQDAVARSVRGDGVEVVESGESVVAIVTSDHVAGAASSVMIVIGGSEQCDLAVTIDGDGPRTCHVTADRLHALVLELASEHADRHPDLTPLSSSVPDLIPPQISKRTTPTTPDGTL